MEDSDEVVAVAWRDNLLCPLFYLHNVIDALPAMCSRLGSASTSYSRRFPSVIAVSNYTVRFQWSSVALHGTCSRSLKLQPPKSPYPCQ